MTGGMPEASAHDHSERRPLRYTCRRAPCRRRRRGSSPAGFPCACREPSRALCQRHAQALSNPTATGSRAGRRPLAGEQPQARAHARAKECSGARVVERAGNVCREVAGRTVVGERRWTAVSAPGERRRRATPEGVAGADQRRAAPGWPVGRGAARSQTGLCHEARVQPVDVGGIRALRLTWIGGSGRLNSCRGVDGDSLKQLAAAAAGGAREARGEQDSGPIHCLRRA
jgi:hypothetical protein